MTMPSKNKKPTTATRKAKRKPVKKQQVSFDSIFKAHHIAIFAILSVFAFGAYVILSTHTTAAASGSQFVSGVQADKCLDNSRNIRANGNKIQLYTCNKTEAQSWTANSDGTITNINGYCLDVKSAGTKAGTIVQLYQCNQTKAQQWTLKSDGSIVNPSSSLCLDDKYSDTANGTQIWLWGCNGTKAQKWSVQSVTTSPNTPPSTTTPPSNGGSSSSSPSGQAMPVGNISGWKQIFADDFTSDVPVGAFSDCNHNVDTPQAYCGGLKKYGNYYNNWWAYPNGWDDTSLECIKHENGCPDTSLKIPVGGGYQPEKAVSVSGGAMHIKMSRPSKGNNIVATVVPRACMNREYGRYVERFKVVHADPGFKSAHLFYQDNYEMDYPENDYGSPISAYTHPSEESFDTGAKWTTWHTTAIEWTSKSIKYYMDGKLVGTATHNIPHLKMTWALQNESSIMGPYAKVGAYAQLDTDWVTCYAQA